MLYNTKRDKMKKDKINLLEKLEIYRLENKLSQVKLAKDLGVHFSTYNRWITGKKLPNKIWTYHIEKFLKQKGIIK